MSTYLHVKCDGVLLQIMQDDIEKTFGGSSYSSSYYSSYSTWETHSVTFVTHHSNDALL